MVASLIVICNMSYMPPVTLSIDVCKGAFLGGGNDVVVTRHICCTYL